MDLHIDPSLLLSQATDTSQQLQSGSGKNPAARRRVCQEFEAILVQSMFKAMRATVPDSGLLDKGTDSEIYQELLDQEVARKLSANQGLGIAEMLYRQWYDES